jgi:cytochrome c5
MTMDSKHLLLALVVVASSVVLAQTAPQDKTPAAQENKNYAAAGVPQQHEDDGARVFQQNCSRCHNTPESFSPRISGTILRHMRVRASLSKRDEEELLRFLNP